VILSDVQKGELQWSLPAWMQGVLFRLDPYAEMAWYAWSSVKINNTFKGFPGTWREKKPTRNQDSGRGLTMTLRYP